jgi:hypothetical protein
MLPDAPYRRREALAVVAIALLAALALLGTHVLLP